jgi:hypothetical protein
MGLSSFAQEGNTISETLPKLQPVTNEAEYKPHMALLAGLSTPEGSYDTGGAYGIDVGFQPFIPLSLSAELSQAAYNADSGDDFKRTSLLAKVAYNFGGTIPVIKNSYVGLGGGMLIEDSGPSTTTYGGLMPNLGFDIPTFTIENKWVSLGATARYMITASNAPDVFDVNGVLKYWF